MSTRAHPIAFIGFTFETSNEVLDYLSENNVIDNEELAHCQKIVEEDETTNLEYELDFSHLENFPNLEMIDYSVSEGYFLGYKLDVEKLNTDPNGFLKDIEAAKSNWKKFFQEEIQVGSLSQYI